MDLPALQHNRAGFYRWKVALEKHVEAALVRKGPIPKYQEPNAPVIVVKVLHLRMTHHLGPKRIVWYLERHQDTNLSVAGISRVPRRNGLNHQPRRTVLRKVNTTC